MYCTKCNSEEQGTERMLNFCFGGKVLNIVTVLMVVTNSSHIWLFPWEYYGVLSMDKRDQVLHIWSRLRWSRVSQVVAVCVCVCVWIRRVGAMVIICASHCCDLGSIRVHMLAEIDWSLNLTPKVCKTKKQKTFTPKSVSTSNYWSQASNLGDWGNHF